MNQKKRIWLCYFIVTGLLLIFNNGCKKANEWSADKVKDVDGNVYNTITIGTQVWLKENLRVTRFNDGTPIPLVTNDAEWPSLTTPAYCWYNNDISNKDSSGVLYNGYAVLTGKLCPTGWHVSSMLDWHTLADPYRPNNPNLSEMYGYGLMESGTSHWLSGLGTNESGFTALPGGTRYSTFSGIGISGLFWSSDIDYGHGGEMRYFYVPFSPDWDRFVSASFASPKDGFSVRCLKDN
jgi:uncharacterized protein (TIGR02145 family)